MGGESEIVRRCLQAAVEGSFFPEWEFQTIIGAPRATVRAIWLSWPEVQIDDAAGAVNNVLSNLLGYPHGSESELLTYVPEGRPGIERALDYVRRSSGTVAGHA